MTDTETAPPEGQQPSTEIFTGDSGGLRKAAAELTAQRPQEPPPETPELDLPDRTGPDGENIGVTARDAARALTSWREEKEAERKAFEAAVFGTGEADHAPAKTEPSPTIETPAAEQPPQDLPHLWEAEIQQHTLQAFASAFGQVQGAFNAQFPDIKNQGDLVRLARENPQRFADAVEFSNQAEQALLLTANQAQQNAQQQSVARVRVHEDWGVQQDAEWEAAHPELADPKVRGKITGATMEILKEAGLTENQITAGWHGLDPNLSFLRNAKTQSVLSDAAKFRLAQKSIREGRGRKPVPPVQRPGSAGNLRNAGEILVHDAEAAMDKNPSIRNAARLLGARRRATG